MTMVEDEMSSNRIMVMAKVKKKTFSEGLFHQLSKMS